jgi:DNA-binding MarR family transcriptional regulator
MVKQLDKKANDAPDNHIGWLLWNATERWLDRFVSGMQAAGHDWFGPSQARLMGHLMRQGTRQGDLADSTGLTKQAIQQALDELEAKSIVRREPDPQDRRGRIIRYTPAGLAALADGDRIKRKIERAAVGEMKVTDVERLKANLVELATRLDRS